MQKAALKEERPSSPFLFLYATLGWAGAVIVGIIWALLAKSMALPKLVAAQTSLGVFGFAGGMSQYRLFLRIGGAEDRRLGFKMAAGWGGCLAFAVTPLFFIFGSQVKMALFAFSFFFIAGALGGLITVRVWNRMITDRPCPDRVPLIALWAFSLGLGALSVYLAAAVLEWVLPEPTAMVLAIGTMAMVIGAGNGLFIHLCRSDESAARGFLKPDTVYDRVLEEGSIRYGWPTMTLLFVPFFLNDFSNIFVEDWRWWLFIDYVVVRALPFLILCRMLSRQNLPPEVLGIGPQSGLNTVVVYIVGTLAALLLLQNKFLIGITGYPPLGNIPRIMHPDWRWFDLTAGLMAAGVVEELVFRAFLFALLYRYTRRPLTIVWIGGLAFGLIHWSLGFQHVAATSVIGAIYMMLYMRTRALPALILAHYTANFIEFSDLVDKFVFRYF